MIFNNKESLQYSISIINFNQFMCNTSEIDKIKNKSLYQEEYINILKDNSVTQQKDVNILKDNSVAQQSDDPVTSKVMCHSIQEWFIDNNFNVKLKFKKVLT